MRRIGIITTSRAEYGILRAVLKRIMSDDDLHLLLFVGGTHLLPQFGLSIREIEHDGFPIAERIQSQLADDSPEGIAMTMGLTTLGFAQAFARTRPDILLVSADRYEMFAAASAAVPFNIPIAHLGGGDVTRGAFDDQWRDAMTKLAHIHFAYTYDSANRLLAMGEDSSRVHMTGDPAIDSILACPKMPTGMSGCMIIVYHPVTRELDAIDHNIQELLDALGMITSWDIAPVFIAPNSDTTNCLIRDRVSGYLMAHPGEIYSNVSAEKFYNLMRHAACIIGNSSSAIREAPSFELPAVNIGNRQAGRVRAANVIDVGNSRNEIAEGIKRALSPEFRESLRGMTNPYGDGHTAERIVKILKEIELGSGLMVKGFTP